MLTRGFDWRYALAVKFYEFSRKYVVVLLRTESIILILLALYLASASLFKSAKNPGALGAEMVFALSGAIGLYICSLGFSRGRSYGRAPAVLANLIALGVAYFMAGSGVYYTAIPLAALAFATLFTALLGYRDGE